MGLIQIKLPEKLHDNLRHFSVNIRKDIKDMIIDTLQDKYGKYNFVDVKEKNGNRN
jgi:hypothetical protein